jgi:hypothetical protein
MSKRYILEVLVEDEGLVDQPSDATFTLASRTGENGVQVSVLETLDETLAAQWVRILDDNDRAYAARVLEGNDVISEQQSVRKPSWYSA